MAIEKIPVAIYKFVMSQLAKKSGKTGITTIPKAGGLNVELTAKQIQKTLESMGLDVSKIKSTKDVQKYLNIHESWMKQQVKKGPKVTDDELRKGIKKSLEDVEMLDPIGPFSKEYLTEGLIKDDPFKGWRPKVIEGGKGKDTVRDITNRLEESTKKIEDILREEKKLKDWKPTSEAFLKQKYEGLNKKTIERIRRRRYEAALKAEREKMAKDSEYIPEIIDPDDFAGGGLAGMLGEPTYSDGGRVPLGGGKFVLDAARRKFLQMMGAGAAGVGAAKSGLFSLLKGGGKKQVVESLTHVPIDKASGAPPWLEGLINRVIKEGDDVTKKLATKEREIVHRAQIDKDTSVDVIQDLETGNIRVEYDAADNMGYGPIQLDYKAGEVVEDASRKAGKEIKTKPEFSAVESEPRVTNWDGDIEFDGENVVNVVDDLFTDTTKLETYATGKNPNIKQLLKSEQKKKYVNKLNDDVGEQLDYIENKQGHMGPDDLMEAEDVAYHKYKEEGLASGGRVPLRYGKRPRSEWLQLLDLDWDDMDPDEFEGILKALGVNKAQGGRVPMFAGELVKPRNWKLFKKFFDRVLIKTSNEIRQGKGKWKDLTQEQRIVQHDNFTQVVDDIIKTGKYDKRANEYVGFDVEKAFAKVEAQVKKPGFIKKGDPITSENFGASQFAPSNERAMIKQKYPGITDDLLNKILIDDNPQRKAEVLATLDQYFELGKRGKSMEEASEIVKQGIRHRTKQASGGLAGMLGE